LITWVLELLLRKTGINIVTKEEIINVARRYFFINAFDGLMISLGVLLGGYFGAHISSKAILYTMLGSVVAMGLSGFFGAYISERAERLKGVKELEEQIYTDLSGTKYETQLKKASVMIALVDALAPVLISLPALFLLALSSINLMNIHLAVYSALGLSLLLLIFLGYELGKLSGEKPLIYSVALLLLGALLAFLTFMIGGV
jgi:predicted membrane protein (TIGR00267 family)